MTLPDWLHAKAWIVIISALLSGCTAYQTFDNVDARELNAETLWPGMRLRVEYEDGAVAQITISEVTDELMISEDGTGWPKTGIRVLAVRFPSNSSDCGRLASWNNARCWRESICVEAELLSCT